MLLARLTNLSRDSEAAHESAKAGIRSRAHEADVRFAPKATWLTRNVK
jgi:hypothetical protein